ncbi:alpha-L-rhamnosidase [Paenibacillus sp. SYP-B4298]|uniref:alpha-L-rhamnosidase n=1 Tax=Paenibacillus sp. SYP-B4298 TaxID=2996034 RepID=UPI0022DD9407|nr:alpha-L-rhamnosidase [Paenibacillus sp. SYP-B4298]
MSKWSVESVTCEYQTRLVGTELQAPRFSWVLNAGERRGAAQSAYRIQVVLAGPGAAVGKGGEATATHAHAGDTGNVDASGAAGSVDAGGANRGSAGEDGADGDGTITADAGVDTLIWDSGKVESSQSVHVEYRGPELSSRTMYRYRVMVWNEAGEPSEWSTDGILETGIGGASAWQAQWITPDRDEIAADAQPSYLLRRSFELRPGVVAARVFATAAGVYELYVNGAKVSGDLLAPGWTSYSTRIQYQTYDVTALLQAGGNGIGIMLGDGWYRGGLGFDERNYMYGDCRAALAELHVRYEDGTEEIIATGADWKAALAPVQYSNIYHGETYDARLEQPGWSSEPFDDAGWKAVERVELPYDQLVAQENWPVTVTEVLRPVAAWVTPAGDHVLDMGQNMVGRMRLTVEAPAGTRIVLRHAEVLDKDGNIYFGNLRPARQTVEYIASGTGVESYAPHFTFMGFRYVKVEGFPLREGVLPIEAFQGEVMHSDMASTGEFECSDERVNQLQRNIRWGQRGNFVDVPTDCPQRDERLGWTGDAQVFISTALFNYQGGPFFTKWLRDLKAEQLADGGVPFVIPDIVGGASSAAWGDAAVICPWTVYQYYGDLRLLGEQYESMKRWVEYIRAQGEREDMWDTGFHFGDWLALDAKENSYVGATPTSLIATAYYAHSTRLVRDAAQALGHDADAQRYSELHRRIVQAFRDEFITANGRVASPTQTAHILALMFELVDGEAKRRVADDLNHLIIENDYHLTTGFVGTPYLCFALSNNGYHDTAVRLLLQESYPGWLYSVSKGATTIWEHWDSIKPDGSFWSDDMNSFNHYAYGAIGDWMYRKIAGLDMDSSEPGYKRIRIEPLYGSTLLTYARAAHQSMYGRIESGWRRDGVRIELSVTIPANTTAEIILRGAVPGGVTESGRALEDAEGITEIVMEEGGLLLRAGSGTYCFIYEASGLFRQEYSMQTRMNELLMDERATEVVRRHAPNLLGGALLSIAKPCSLQQISENAMMRVPLEAVERILADLKAL